MPMIDGKYVAKKPSIVEVLRKISPQNHGSYKQALIKKIQMVTDYMIPSHKAFEGVLSLEQAFELLGRAQARLAMLEDIRKFLMNVLHPLHQWPQELWDLREHTLKQIDLCNRMVRAIIGRQMKEKENGNEQNSPA